MRLWIILEKTGKYGTNTATGIHLKQPTDNQIVDAIGQAFKDGFSGLYIYHSKRQLDHLRDLIIEHYPDQIIGWSDYLLTSNGFVMDTDKNWSKRHG